MDYISLTGLFQFYFFSEFLIKTERFTIFACIKKRFKVLTLSSVFGQDCLLKLFVPRSLLCLEGRAVAVLWLGHSPRGLA